MSELTLESPPADDAPAEYRVLARKYRPTRFADLIGQDAMVQTLGNAIAKDRIAHAFLMTGVRGVGKTSTARLIAKALNCVGPDGTGGPTIDPCGVCEPCRAITEGRFIDVVEMDAASHTGVDDMRDVIDSVRYAAVSGRYKIHIIDEVHMLSKSAFNALLKTLEEPPDHVKFIFATTELNKVPVTVLSRTQRFDLKRIPAELLTKHFAAIAEKEGVKIEENAIRLIAAAAEGSVRDGLSLLDQAIAHGAGDITAEAVRTMLGLSDRGRTRALLGAVLTGDAKAALAELAAQYELGVAPDMAIESLLETVHAMTRIQVGAEVDLVMSSEGHEQLETWAGQMSPAMLHRFWQLLLKGLEEVKRGTMALQTAEMVLLRLIHAAGMPDPGSLMRALEEKTVEVPLVRSEPPLPETAPRREPVDAASPDAPEAAVVTARPVPADYAALVTAVEAEEPMLGAWLYDDVAPVSLEGGELVLTGKRNPMHLAQLSGWLANRFEGALSVRFEEAGEAQTLHQQDEARMAAERAAVLADPNVQRVFAAFPEAELTGYTLEEDAPRKDERRTAR